MPNSAEVWIYRCRVAAVMNALILFTALIVALVVITSANHYCVSVFYASWVAVIYYTSSTTHGPPTIWDKRHRRTPSWREPPTYSTIPHVSCIVVFDHVISSFFTKPIMQCLQYSSGPISVNTPGLDHEIETQSVNTDIYCVKVLSHQDGKKLAANKNTNVVC
jgi:hypothetical protein